MPGSPLVVAIGLGAHTGAACPERELPGWSSRPLAAWGSRGGWATDRADAQPGHSGAPVWRLVEFIGT
eukprot:11281741-Alexandrium_andersonii.AAC.1